MTAVLELNPIPTEDQTTDPVPQNTAPPAGTTVLDIVERAIANDTDMATMTSLYLKLRNAKKDLDAQAKLRLSPLNQGMAKIEAFFLEKMIALKVDSLKNQAGTPYKTSHVSITIADNSAFVDYVLTKALEGLQVSDAAKLAIKNAIVESGQLALIEARANKSAVEAFLEETQELPPGLNRREEAVVNVRAD